MKRTKLAMVALVLAFIMAMPTMVTAMTRPVDEVPQRVEDGVTFVPLRLTAYAYGATLVEWDHENRLVIITHPYGDIWAIVAVEYIGGFIEDGTSWVPYEFALVTFEGEEIIPDENETLHRPQIHGAIHRVEYGYNVAYLFGTMHGGHEYWFPLADVVEDALRRADVLAVEIDEIGGTEEDFEAAIMDAMFLPDGMTWAEFLPEYAYDHLVEMMAEWDIDYEGVNTMNPWALVFSLELQIANVLSDFEIGLGISVDAYIADVAAELDLPIIGLESSEQQTNILFNPPFEVKVAGIMNFLPPAEMIAEIMESDALTLDQMAYYYKMNNLYALAYGFRKEIGADIECIVATYMREKVMNWRSTYYANEIARLLQETEEPTTFFVAVGLSHIIRSWGGEEFTDIVQQLRQQGFTVVPLWE